jgi:parvulin-like peptidyl-prolyl isomerase
MAWRIAWNRYLEREITDEKLKAYFNNHLREFDDSEMRVAHLLVKPETNGSAVGAFKQAESIYADLKSGRLAWNEAVKQNSAAPTRDDAGEIGWITYHKPMPATFSQAAFKLKPGDVSSPVATPFGVHLIKCMELRVGKTGWRDALNEVRQSAIRDLFRQLARSHRPNVSIRYRDGFSEMQEAPGQLPGG